MFCFPPTGASVVSAEEAWVAVAAETRAVLVVEEKDEAAVLVEASAGEAASAAEGFSSTHESPDCPNFLAMFK